MKSLALALFMGVATASSVASWYYPSGNVWKKVVDTELFKFHFKTEFDFGYGTHYYRAEPVDTADDLTYEKYGINAYSYFKAPVEFYLLDFFYLKLSPKFVPAYFVPYEHKITYTAPQAMNGMSLSFSGMRNLMLTTFTLKVYENWKTSTVSLYDAAFDSSGEWLPEKDTWTFDADYLDDFKDPYSTINVLEKLGVITTNEDWYGSHTYYTWNIIN